MRLKEYLDPENAVGFTKQTLGRLADAGEAVGEGIVDVMMDPGKMVGALTEMHPMDTAALMTSPFPVVGDLTEAANLTRRETNDDPYDDPEAWEYGLAAVPGGLAAIAGIPKRVGDKHKTKKVVDADGKRVKRPNKMTEVPDIRGLDADKATKVAEYEPHLLPSSAAGEGAYVGGPRNIKNRRQLTKQRGILDDTIERGAEGGDWYDRYRKSVEDVTGGNKKDDLWMTSIEGQYSAGVDPGSELAFSIKDTNSAIARGKPVKPARPAQQEASIRAIENNDPSEFMLGKKTGEYARRVNPAATHERTATGVNDFRHARNLGYTEVTGEAQRNGLGAPAHRFMDYETALAVDRANQKGLAGRSDWTGEQIQAAPWVAQKADDLYSRGAKSYNNKAQAMAQAGDNRPVEEIAKELAFNDANRTIGDFYGKHTAFATHEPQPYVNAGQLPRLADASDAEKAAFASDPRSRWDFAPGGRDAIYSGMRLDDTGYAVRTRPTTEMQGIYDPPGAAREYNPGYVARPLVAFDSGKVKSVPEADRGLMDAGEATRAYLDVQGAGAWHKPWVGGQLGQSNSVSIARNPGAATADEIESLGKIGDKYGLGDVVDTGEGFTMTRFYPEPDKISSKDLKGMLSEVDEVVPGSDMTRAKVDSGYQSMFEDAAPGSGEVTGKLMDTLDDVPEATRKALDNNPHIPEAAAMRLERDAELATKYGTNRADIQKAREIISEGPGWIGRLKDALSKGVILPATAAVLIRSASEDDEQI